MAVVAIRAEITGTVAVQLVEDGARVEAGDAVLEVECMKVFFTAHAPAAGVLRHRAALGDVVGQDELLATVET